MKLTLRNSAYPLVAICCVAFLSLGISGGPDYGSSKRTIGVTGSYAGTLLPLDSPNNLGIFTAVAPQTGLTTGGFTVFNGGRTFVGTLQGVADPTDATLYATLQGIPVVTGDGTTVTTLNYHADGSLTAKVKSGGKKLTSIIRLKGTAAITTTIGGLVAPSPSPNPAQYAVRGFRQSE